MADNQDKKEDKVEVSLNVLEEMQRKMAEMELKLESESSARAGIEAMLEETKGAQAMGEAKLREKKTFEPKFRTVRLSNYPMANGERGFVIGWTKRGAYQEVDRSGVAPQNVDFIDLIFLDHEKGDKGQLVAEKVKLLDYLNKREQVHCKIIETNKQEKTVETGEEIDISVYDPQHGLITTGEKIDGFYTYSEISYVVEIPGRKGSVKIDSNYCN